MRWAHARITVPVSVPPHDAAPRARWPLPLPFKQLPETYYTRKSGEAVPTGRLQLENGQHLENVRRGGRVAAVHSHGNKAGWEGWVGSRTYRRERQFVFQQTPTESNFFQDATVMIMLDAHRPNRPIQFSLCNRTPPPPDLLTP